MLIKSLISSHKEVQVTLETAMLYYITAIIVNNNHTSTWRDNTQHTHMPFWILSDFSEAITQRLFCLVFWL